MFSAVLLMVPVVMGLPSPLAWCANKRVYSVCWFGILAIPLIRLYPLLLRNVRCSQCASRSHNKGLKQVPFATGRAKIGYAFDCARVEFGIRPRPAPVRQFPFPGAAGRGPDRGCTGAAARVGCGISCGSVPTRSRPRRPHACA